MKEHKAKATWEKITNHLGENQKAKKQSESEPRPYKCDCGDSFMTEPARESH